MIYTELQFRYILESQMSALQHLLLKTFGLDTIGISNLLAGSGTGIEFYGFGLKNQYIQWKIFSMILVTV